MLSDISLYENVKTIWKWNSRTRVRLFATPWTIQWMEFSRSDPFSGGSSQPRDQTQVSLIAGGFFTIWATRGSPARQNYL